MIARVLPVLLLLAAAPAVGTAAGSAPESDPFLAALAGKSGPDSVAAPSFDPDVEAASWTTRPRREIVDALAARLLRGEAKGWYEPAKEAPALPAPPSRIPADFEAGTFEISDRLAARVPADAAAVLFGSLEEAEAAADELAKFLPKALPVPFADAPEGRRDALSRAVEMLLLPTIWRSNPAVRRGTRQAALLASDPDLRWAPEVALVVEVDDASLVRFHRLSTLSFENRGRRRLRVDGLDAVADDGSVRSFFGLEGGIAVWSTGKDFRDRILAAAAGKAPTLLSPDPRAYALARTTFPAKVTGPLLVIPDGFLERANSAALRARRAAALRCDAVRMVLAARSLAGRKEPSAIRLDCPSGGTITVSPGSPAATCSTHGTAVHPTPLGDVPSGAGVPRTAMDDVVGAGAVPVAAQWRDGSLEVLVPSGNPGAALMKMVMPPEWHGHLASGGDPLTMRLDGLRAVGVGEMDAVPAYVAVFGEAPESRWGLTLAWKDGRAVWEGKKWLYYLETYRGDGVPRPEGGVLRIGSPRPSTTTCGFMNSGDDLPLEWR